MNNQNVFYKLKKEDQEKWDSIMNGQVLGASQHLQLITEIAESIDHYEISMAKRIDLVQQVFAFFIEERGKASHAVMKGLQGMMKNIRAAGKSTPDQAIQKVINEFRRKKEEDMEVIIQISVNLLQSYHRIMLFDYSSSVEKSIARLNEKKVIVIPESRIIDGGLPFLNPLIMAGHNVHFIYDAAIFAELKKCDAAVIGAETLDIDGGVYNTVGSDMVAYLCHNFNIPLYVITTLSKYDENSQFGKMKSCGIKQGFQKAGQFPDEALKAQLNTVVRSLVKVPAYQISGYVTEEGFLPPSGICTLMKGES